MRFGHPDMLYRFLFDRVTNPLLAAPWETKSKRDAHTPDRPLTARNRAKAVNPRFKPNVDHRNSP
jgi:hypothetical protein